MRYCYFPAVAAMLLTCGASPAAAQTIVFDNGLPDQTDGVPIAGGVIEADDFILPGPASITDVTFYTLGDPASQGALTYSIYSGTGSLPDMELISGTAQNVSISATGATAGAYPEYRVSFSLTSPFAASASTQYWLGLHYVSGSSIYWETTANNSSIDSAVSSNNGASWATRPGYDLAFSLADSTPEPASWAMMIGGFGLIGGAMRTKRRRPPALA